MSMLRVPATRPLLKWAGGKRQLLPALRPYYPGGFSRYIEPFFGSGAVFFDLFGSGRLTGRQVCLTDANADLIGCYRMVRDRTDEVIAALEDLATGHAGDAERFYYEVRDRRFNPIRAGGSGYTPELAAMVVYLNRTGFNGLFRLNSRGAFNVPIGRYTNPRICDAAHIREVARALSATGVTIEQHSFEHAIETAGAGDFVYCDPPYAPLSATARFANYTAGGFSAIDQARLQQAICAAARRGAWIVLSNSSAPAIVSAYQHAAARTAGLTVHRAPARRAINSRADARGTVDELIVTNAAYLQGKLRMAKKGLPVRSRRLSA